MHFSNYLSSSMCMNSTELCKQLTLYFLTWRNKSAIHSTNRYLSMYSKCFIQWECLWSLTSLNASFIASSLTVLLPRKQSHKCFLGGNSCPPSHYATPPYTQKHSLPHTHTFFFFPHMRAKFPAAYYFPANPFKLNEQNRLCERLLFHCSPPRSCQGKISVCA